MTKGINKKLITNTLVYAVFAAAVWFALGPAWSGFRTERKEAVLKKEAIVLERQVVDKLNAVSHVLDSHKDNVARLGEAVPPSESKPEILSMMENLASQNGLALSAVNVESPDEGFGRAQGGRESKPAGAVKNLKVTAELSGSYGAFKSWLTAVEKNLRILDVTEISFAVEEKKSPEGEVVSAVDPVMDYTVTMNTYVLRNK